MSHLLFWPTVTFFYPTGNISAVCLTEHLSPESKADILLLACGDPRHILYTIYVDETNPLARQRTLDITCCDVDVAILARNTLLFTILADEGAEDKLDNLWNLFYHIFVDAASLSILFEQCRKLVTLAESPETWRAGPYGHFLTTCDAVTLFELRRVWQAYLDTSTLSPKQTRRLKQHIMDSMNEISQKTGNRGATTAARSAGPLFMHADRAVSDQFSSYWSSGTTDNATRGQGLKHLIPNPTFRFSIDGDKFSVHYGTDPLSGFHLAEVFASGEFTRTLPDRVPTHEMVRIAKEQFSHWCRSVTRRLKNRPSSPTFVLRLFAGDLLMFCQALKYCEVSHSTITPYNVAAWRLSTISLDDHQYGPNAVSSAPRSFNVIDTSNILDHVGLLNVLVVTAPLLRKTPSATLYTEALLRTGSDPSYAIFERVCGDVATMALLLGIIPSTFISQFTTRSHVHETITMTNAAKQHYERLAWKVIGLAGSKGQTSAYDTPRPSQRLYFPCEDLAAFLFRVYVSMFFDEDVTSRLQLLSLSPDNALHALRRSEVLHYNRRSFALLVHFVKTRVQTDWWRTMDLLEDMVLAESRLITGQHAYQELCCQLHLLDVYTTPWLSRSTIHEGLLEYGWDNIVLFRNWTPSSIPLIITLVLVVPRDAIAKLEPAFTDVGTPVLHCDMHDGLRQNWFAVTSATFGSLHVSGEGEHQIGVVVEGGGDAETMARSGVGAGTAMLPPWRTGAPLIVTFSVPSSSVMDFAMNPRATVGLSLHPTMSVTAKFADILGYNLTVFRTPLADAKRVFLLAKRPVVGTRETMSGGGGVVAGAATAGHWKENMKEDPCSKQATSSSEMPGCTDVHVQMDEMFSAARSFTVRIDVTDPRAKAALANAKTIPTVDSSFAPSLDACVRIGIHKFPVHFPLPVDTKHAKLRVARKSSYIEVVAPLASFDVRPERDISLRFAPLSSGFFDDDATPTLGSIHRLNLDRCPPFKHPKGLTNFGWCDLHVGLMLSENERGRMLCLQAERPATSPNPDTLLQVKLTLHLILRRAGGATPVGKTPEKVFMLCDTSRRGVPYLYIIVGCMRLDVGSHTVVADAFVAPATPTVRAALGTALGNAFTHESGAWKPDVRCIGTDADETAAWFHLLPRLTERCRAWPHKPSCAYRTFEREVHKTGEQTIGTWGDQGPLCACGAGVGTDFLPKVFEPVAPYLTRAALSPLFSVPYLKEVDPQITLGTSWKGKPSKSSEERADTLSDDRNTVVRRPDGVKHRCISCGGEGGLTCNRCKRARYCSKACQRVHWKSHKSDCKVALDVASGSNQAF